MATDRACGTTSAIALSIVLTGASLAAAVLLSVNGVEHWVVAAVAAIPAACRTLQSLVDFRRRSNWYFSYTDDIRALLFELRYDDRPELPEFAKRWGQIEKADGETWSQMSSSSAAFRASEHPLLDPGVKETEM